MAVTGRTKITTTISKTGPFFTKDPQKTFKANVKVLMDAVAVEAASDVIAQMLAGEGGREPISIVQPDRVSRHVIGRTQSVTGKRWTNTAVISVLNVDLSKAEGTALMAAAAEIEQVDHVFRRTANRIRRSRAVNRAELMKGLT